MTRKGSAVQSCPRLQKLLFPAGILFETTEHSYHGHPRPVASPQDVSRKSLAVYYYSREREEAAIAPEHNTHYRQTTGLAGYLKTARSSLEATVERLQADGVVGVARPIADKLAARLLGRGRTNN